MLSRNINYFNRAFLSRQGDENRKGGRFRTTSVTSDLGKVLDLLHCDAMVLKRRFSKVPALAEFPVKLTYHELSVTVTARIARQIKQRGVGHLIGMELIDVTPEQRDVIKEIIRDSRCWETLPGTSSDSEAA